METSQTLTRRRVKDKGSLMTFQMTMAVKKDTGNTYSVLDAKYLKIYTYAQSHSKAAITNRLKIKKG